MSCFETGTVINLAPRQVITLADVRGTTLRVTRGTVWLTQERDPRDIMLRPGDSWVVERDGDTVIESQGDTLLCASSVRNGALPNAIRGAARRPAGWLAAAGAWLSAPPRHQVPYA
jgi:hypothetical protein